ncbi:hypothetical protein ACEPAI_3641 [Sanghuangporus weigelae]
MNAYKMHYRGEMRSYVDNSTKRRSEAPVSLMGGTQAGVAVDIAATGANQEVIKDKEGLTGREAVTINLQDQEGDISRDISAEVKSAHKGPDDLNRIAEYSIS